MTYSEDGARLRRFKNASNDEVEPNNVSLGADSIDGHDLVGEVIATHYQIVSKVGEGSVGEVFKAKHTLLGNEVAIKILRPECLRDADAHRRFRQEASAAIKLNHPNVVPFVISGLLERSHLTW